MDSLNEQLQQITNDYMNKQEMKAIRERLVADPEFNRVNAKIHELRSYNPYNAVAPPAFTNPTPVPQQQTPSHVVVNPQSASQHTRSQQQPQLRTAAIGTREDMNTRMGQFQFDNTTFQRGSLVPVNLDHLYSGNLFTEGNPVPEELKNEFMPGARHPGRVHYQEKSKTVYRDEFNERLNALSPLSRTLFFPLTQQEQAMAAQPMTGQQQPTNQRRDDMNTRMSQHQPLATAAPPNYTGGSQTSAYGHMYPVSSK